MIKKIIHIFTRLTEDRCSFIVHKSIDFRLSILRHCSGLFTHLSAYIKGIIIGENCKFYGIPYFYRYPYSKITIGQSCRFRSDSTSNLIGINHKCILSTHGKSAILEIGNSCGLSGVSIGAAMEIRIGNNVLCGANVVITDFDWHSDRSHTLPSPVIIHDNVWIGLNSTILKGVEIGENTIIGANSLVVKSIPANVVAGGNPCKIIKNINS